MKLSTHTGTGRRSARAWLPVLPTLIIAIVVLTLTSNAQAAPVVQRVRLTELLFQTQEPLCQTCHVAEYEAWKNTTHAKATLDPVFQEQLSKTHNQEACLACHTTGFDSGSGEFMAEGVTCEACHGAHKEGHPKAETMQLPMESNTCRLCHLTTFAQWETSQHAANRIDCFDCHQAHTQGLRLGSQEKLCAACHSDEKTRLSHSVHGITGVDCNGCHMTPQAGTVNHPTGSTTQISDHTFTVASDVCVRCHSSSIHSTTENPKTTASNAASTALAAELQSQRVAELEQALNAAQQRTTDLRNLAIVAMGLTLGVGGMIGLLLGVGGAVLLARRKQS